MPASLKTASVMHSEHTSNISTSTVTLSNPAGLYDPTPNGYSHVAVVQLPARLVHIAGQGGEDAQGRLSPVFEDQVVQALANLQRALASVDAGLADVARVRVLVVDHDDRRLELLARQMRAYWGDAGAPTCTLIPVSRLALEGMLFEIEAEAYTR